MAFYAQLFTSLLSGAAGAIGSGGGLSRRTLRRRGMHVLGLEREALRRYFGQAEGRYKKALKSIEEGGKAERGEISRLGDTYRRQALDREKETSARTTQSLMDRGLTNTTILDNAQRGVRADTDRRLQDIDARLATLFASSRRNQAGGTARAQQRLGDLATRRYAAESNLFGDQLRLFTGMGGGGEGTAAAFAQGFQGGGGFGNWASLFGGGF